MNFKEYPTGLQLLLNDEDNSKWIPKVTCWLKNESQYNIYVFTVNIENEADLLCCHETVASSIATGFQASLEKSIERWNIYLIFMCSEIISAEFKSKVEQDKYSTRKLVWDQLSIDSMQNGEFINNELFELSFGILRTENNSSFEENNLWGEICSKDELLFSILKDNTLEIDQCVALYIGGTSDGEKN